MKVCLPGIKTFIFGRYGGLLTSLLAVMLIQPLVKMQVGKLLIEVVFVAILFAGLRAIKIKKELLVFAVVLVVTSIICGIIGNLVGNEIVFVLALAGRSVFLSLVALIVLLDLFRGRQVTGDTLAGAVCVYLLIALIWAYGFLLIEFVAPESFSFTQGHERIKLWNTREFYPFFYFSLVTMTTVGYGDMAPVTTEARTLATMEALVGQIYLAILVARLVGMYLVNQRAKEG